MYLQNFVAILFYNKLSYGGYYCAYPVVIVRYYGSSSNESDREPSFPQLEETNLQKN